jgi:hypothetical protein
MLGADTPSAVHPQLLIAQRGSVARYRSPLLRTYVEDRPLQRPSHENHACEIAIPLPYHTIAAGVQFKCTEGKAAAELAPVRTTALYTQQHTLRRSYDFLEYLSTSPEEGGDAETGSLTTMGMHRCGSFAG